MPNSVAVSGNSYLTVSKNHCLNTLHVFYCFILDVNGHLYMSALTALVWLLLGI
jgi:hypothetical protein